MCLINSPRRESTRWLEGQGLLVVCLGRVAKAEGNCEMDELGWHGPRRPLGREAGEPAGRSQISNPFRSAGGFLLQAEVGFASAYGGVCRIISYRV